MFTLEALNANEGDCLLLRYDDGGGEKLIVIDGGPRTVYEKVLRPRLEQIVADRNTDGRLPIRLLMVSHIDDDHINGVLAFLNDEDAKRVLSQPQFARITTLWHNSFDDIIGNHATPTELVKEAASAASVGMAAFPFLDREKTGLVLASVAQGRDVRDAAGRLSIPLNKEFAGKLIVAPHAPINMGDGLTFTVLGPLQKRVDALQKEWDRQLKAKKLNKTAVAEIVDRAVANLASIIVLAEHGGKTMLLTGDARGDDLIEGLDQAGLLDADGKFHCDLLKVPHHGSARNTDLDFFKAVTADHYVISADGRHDNPDEATLEYILTARGNDAYKVHFTNALQRVKDFYAREKKPSHRFTVGFAKDNRVTVAL